jgi:1,2-diacylglycerol 3-beta-glucosyltransferase
LSNRSRPSLLRLIHPALLVLAAQLIAVHTYLLTLLWAARRRDRHPSGEAEPRPGDTTRFVVLVPAHDEEHGVSATVGSLISTDYPADHLRIVVIADNCSDDTAAAAHRAGAEVWERDDPRRRAKGFALAWALEQLEIHVDTFDAVAIVDADCTASPNLFAAMDLQLRRGSRALQSDYVVSNPDSGESAALRFAAFALVNTVRPMGKQQLGLSCGLLGTGMVFTSDLLAQVPWRDSGLAEDGEYHLRLVAAGERVEFVAEASVRSPMPTTFNASRHQQARWEQGRLRMARRAPRLLARGILARDPVRMHSSVEILVPPQSLLAVCNLSCLLSGFLLRSRRLTSMSAATLTAQISFVLLGLRLVGAPPRVYRALCAAPSLIIRKLVLYARLMAGGGPRSWVRTDRNEGTSSGSA